MSIPQKLMRKPNAHQVASNLAKRDLQGRDIGHLMIVNGIGRTLLHVADAMGIAIHIDRMDFDALAFHLIASVHEVFKPPSTSLVPAEALTIGATNFVVIGDSVFVGDQHDDFPALTIV